MWSDPMRKKLLLLTTSTLILCCNALIVSGQAGNQNAPETPRFEIGGQIFSFHGHELGFGWGAGTRFTYNVNDYLALDNEIDFFLPDEGAPYATQALAGVKVGKHGRHLGLFAKARPGFQTNFV